MTGEAPRPVTNWVDGPSSQFLHVMSRDCRHIVVLDSTRAVSLWVHADDRLTKTSEVKGATNLFNRAAFSPDGKLLAVFALGGTALYAVRDNKLIPVRSETIPSIDTYDGCFSPDGKHLALGGLSGDGGFVQVYDIVSDGIEEAVERHTWRFPVGIRRVLYAPDGRHLLVNGVDGVLYILRLSS